MPLKDIIAVMVSTPGVEAAQSTHVIVYVVAAFLSVGLLVLLLMLVKWGLQWYLSWLPMADEWVHNIWRVKLAPHPVPNLMALGAFLIALLIFVPWIHSWLIVSDKLSEKDALEVANETRKTIAQIMAGMAAIVAFYFAWLRNYLTAQGQITDRFSKAVEQLGSDQISIRMGGIFALERIAKDSPEDHWTVMEVLTAFTREKSPANPKEEEKPDEAKKDKDDEEIPKLPNDIQAALTVIARRGNLEWEKENDKWIDLSGADLRRADLWGAKLDGAILFETRLDKADLRCASLKGAWLIKSNLQEANMLGAELIYTDFRLSQLQRANFQYSKMQGAILINTQLQKSSFDFANMTGADFQKARLKGANMISTQLHGVDLRGAQLQGANLFGAKLQGALLEDAQLQGTDLSGTFLQGAILYKTQLKGAHLREAELQGADLSDANITGCYFIDTEILGTRFENCTIDGVMSDLKYNEDTTPWDEIISKTVGFPNYKEVQERLARAKRRVAVMQKDPSPLPDALKEANDDDRFVEVNKELAMTDSYIAESFLSMWGNYRMRPLYEDIHQHIKDTLNNNPNHPIRKELEARGKADLFKEENQSGEEGE